MHTEQLGCLDLCHPLRHARRLNDYSGLGEVSRCTMRAVIGEPPPDRARLIGFVIKDISTKAGRLIPVSPGVPRAGSDEGSIRPRAIQFAQWPHLRKMLCKPVRVTGACAVARRPKLYVVDVGHSSKLHRTGMCAVDGARFLERAGAARSLVSLVAFHTGAEYKADARPECGSLVETGAGS